MATTTTMTEEMLQSSENIGPHARLTHDDVRAPADPAPFTEPTLRRAERDVDVSVTRDDGTKVSVRAYVASFSSFQGVVSSWLEEEERTVVSAYRHVKDLPQARNGKVSVCLPLVGEGMGDLVVIKEIDKSNPGAEEAGRNEAAAMQFVRPDRNRHVLSSIEALEDEKYLYIVMPYCEGGDVFSWMYSSPHGRCREADARTHFRQLLRCMHHLQSIGVCHGDISPENIMIRQGRCVLIDLDASIRVPCRDDDPSRPLLMKPRFVSGKYPYMAPEVFLSNLPVLITRTPGLWKLLEERGYDFAESPPFDGYAADLWTLGTTLYAMLTGTKLYEIAPFHFVDVTYGDLIYHDGNLATILSGMPLSRNAADLLVGMLKHNAADRLTLEQIMCHPWVCDLPQEGSS